MNRLETNLRSERVVIGCAIEAPEIMESLIADGIVPEDFSLSTHRRIWAALLKMHSDRLPVDSIALLAYLNERESDFSAVCDCVAGCAVNLDHAKHHAQIIKRSAKGRRLQYVADSISESLTANFDPDKIERRVRQILDGAELRSRADFPTEASHAS